MFFVVDKSDKMKAICLNCKEKVSRGGSNPKNFNTTNLQKHLTSHKGEFQCLLIEKRKRLGEKQAAKQNGTDLKQVTLEALAEKRNLIVQDIHDRTQLLTMLQR